MTTEQILATCRMNDAPFEVVVGNIGTVFVGSEREAKIKFNVYMAQSIGNYGRAGGEDVTMFRNGEIVREFVGRNSIDDEPDYDGVEPHNQQHLASGAPLRTESID